MNEDKTPNEGLLVLSESIGSSSSSDSASHGPIVRGTWFGSRGGVGPVDVTDGSKLGN
jgi:hypothetical protein